MDYSELLGDAYTEGMTEEEALTAINTQMSELKTALSKAHADNDSYKKSMDKANSEAAGYKKQSREAQENAAKAQSDYEALIQEVNALKRENSVAKAKAEFLSVGFEDALASDAAVACIDGDISKILENVKTFVEWKTKAIQADIMKSTPRPSGSAPENVSESNLAEKLGQAKTERDKKSREILNLYTRRN